jgi:CPA2 family monovalent cation:H+ antiporter-2
MAEHRHLLDVLILLLALLAFVPPFQRLKMGSVLAYLTAGIVVGPSSLGLISDIDATRPFAELGVVFMLFTIGLEISPERLKLFGRNLYGLAAAQVIVTSLALALCAWRLGFAPLPAFIVGGILTFSSTAVALQLLSERGQVGSQLGRSAVAVLLIQDLAVAPLIVFISGGASGTGDDLAATLGITLAKFTAFAAALWAFDRRALRPFLRLAVHPHTPEVFMAATLLLVLGIGWLSEVLGLSMALGAFAAGMLVADTEFRHQVAADLQPFRGLLLGLFFMTVGMGLDLDYALGHAGAIAAGVATVLTIKAVVLSGLALALGLPPMRALALGGLLSQLSEFSFVLLVLAVGAGLISSELGQLLSVVVGVSMVTTPIGAVVVDRLFPAGFASTRSLLGNLEQETGQLKGHVVVAGFGQVGMAVTRFLTGEHVPVLVLDLTPKRVETSRARGLPVFFGNATRIDVLRAAHIERARALVVAVSEPNVAEQITAIAHSAAPRLPVFVRAPDEQWVARMKAAGAVAIVLDGVTTGLDLAERVIVVPEPDTADHPSAGGANSNRG